jgi:hypothetical protein
LILACVLAFSALSVASCGNSDSKKNNADTGVIGGVDGASLETGGLEVAKGVDSGSVGVDAGVGVDVGVVTIDSGPAIGLEVGSEAGVAVDTQIPDMNTTLPDGPTVRLDGSSVLPDGSSSVLPDAPIAPDALIVNIDAGIDSSAPSVDGGIDSTTTPLGPTSTITNTSTNTNTVTSSNTVTNSNTSTSSNTVTSSNTSTSTNTVTSSNTATVTVTSTGTSTQTSTAAYVIGWPTSLDFGATDCAGTAPANISFTLTNEGTGPAQFTQADFLSGTAGTAGFSLTDNIVGQNIFPYNRTFVVTIQALPIESGFALTDTLRIVTSIPGDPEHLIQIGRSGKCGESGCPDGLTSCGNDCVNLLTNPSNCGVCANACSSQQTCSAGVCSSNKCGQGESYCAQKCIPTQNDLNNCGGCGVVCPTGQTCQQGVCQVPPAAGGDLIVFNDINMFDETGMDDANNKLMVQNLLTFASVGARSSGTVVLWSRGHGSVCGTYKSSDPTDYCAKSNFSKFYSLIQTSGMTVQDSTSNDLSTIDNGVKVLLLWMPLVTYTADEINAFKQFAAEGGRLVFIGEHSGYYGSGGINLENSFLANMGALMTNTGGAVDCGYTVEPGTSLRPHQVTTGMTDVTVACASVIVLGPHDYPLFYDTTNTQLLGGVAKISTTPLASVSLKHMPPPRQVTIPLILQDAAGRVLNASSSTGF